MDGCCDDTLGKIGIVFKKPDVNFWNMPRYNNNKAKNLEFDKLHIILDLQMKASSYLAVSSPLNA